MTARGLRRTPLPQTAVPTGARALIQVGAIALVLLTAGCTGYGGHGGPAAPATGSAARVVPTVPPPVPAPDPQPDVVEVVILQINDVYEITPIEGGKVGGMARVAAIEDRFLAENPNTVMMLAGDFLSPSAIGTAEVDGERLSGKQMVDVLNSAGLDWATFGNHEFDVKEGELRARLEEADFGMVSGNVAAASGVAFPGVQTHAILTFAGPGGDQVRIGIISATLQTGAPDWVAISDPLAALRAQAAALDPETDVIVALTHLALEDDEAVAVDIPAVDVVLGGHEHENWQIWRGGDLTPIFKADANARTVYIHRLRYDTRSGKLAIASELLPITDALPEDPATAAIANAWVDKAFDAFRAQGFEPEEVVADVPVALDGRSSVVRVTTTALTDLVGAAMAAGVPEAELAIYNSGSIRIDDVLPPGPVSQYDVIRILPFGGAVVYAEMTGELLARVLDQGVESSGNGGYLHTANVSRTSAEGPWLVSGAPLDPDRVYKVAITDFLLTGREAGLDYLTRDEPGVIATEDRDDIRKMVIDQMRTEYGGGGTRTER